MNKTLRNLIIFGLFVIPFIPLYIANPLFFPYITGKNFAFRIIVEILCALWIPLAMADKKYRPKKSWIGIALALFVLVLALADLLGPNPYKSFWSNFERMEGWITIIHLFAYFYILAAVFNEKLWNWFFNTSLVASLCVCIYGFEQLAGKVQITQGGLRLDATLGNAAYLAGYLLIHAFIALLLMWRYRRNLWAVLYYAAALIVELVILYYTATRGAVLGLVGGFILASVIFVIHDFRKPHKELFKLRVGAIILVLVIILGGATIWANKRSSFVTSSPMLSRIVSISQGDAAPRVRIWTMAWKGFKERPILGWGQEGFNFVFNKNYDPNMWNQEAWFDRAHNVFFDWLIAGGIFGLLGYLSLFFFALWYLWKNPKLHIIEKSLLTGLFTGYFIHNFFVFDNLVSYLLFIPLVSYIHDAASSPIKMFEKWKEFTLENTRALLGASMLVFVIVLYMLNIRPINANTDLLSALMALNKGNYSQSLDDFKKVFAAKTFATGEALEQLSQLTLSVIGNPNTPEDVKRQFFSLAQKEFPPFVDAHSNDARYEYYYGLFLNKLGLYAEAKPYLEKAAMLSPSKQAILFELGVNQYARGDNKAGFATFKKAYDLAPAYPLAQDLYQSALKAGNK